MSMQSVPSGPLPKRRRLEFPPLFDNQDEICISSTPDTQLATRMFVEDGVESADMTYCMIFKKSSEAEMSSGPTIHKHAITIRLDPQPWNEGAYIGFTGIPENFVVEQRMMRSKQTARSTETNLNTLGAQTASIHQSGFETGPSRPNRKNEVPDAEPTPSAPSDPNEIILSYPPGLGALNITNADIERLSPTIFINDSLIEFGLKVWLRDLEISNPELADQIHVFSPFFYKRLSQESSEDSYEGVRKWTKNTDIFRKRCIFVPINEVHHWYLAIIYEPAHALRDFPVDGHSTAEAIPEVDSNFKTYIFTLDSLGSAHGEVVNRLSTYLRMEAKSRISVDLAGTIEGKTVPVPYQTNSFDCGIYLLHFARTFMSDPRKYARIILSQPKRIGNAERKAIWLVNKNFEQEGRQQLRLWIETLSKDWKKVQEGAQESGEVTTGDNESEGEVEFI